MCTLSRAVNRRGGVEDFEKGGGEEGAKREQGGSLLFIIFLVLGLLRWENSLCQMLRVSAETNTGPKG